MNIYHYSDVCKAGKIGGFQVVSFMLQIICGLVSLRFIESQQFFTNLY